MLSRLTAVSNIPVIITCCGRNGLDSFLLWNGFWLTLCKTLEVAWQLSNFYSSYFALHGCFMSFLSFQCFFFWLYTFTLYYSSPLLKKTVISDNNIVNQANISLQILRHCVMFWTLCFSFVYGSADLWQFMHFKMLPRHQQHDQY